VKYQTIIADPPWQQPLTGNRKRAKGGVAPELPYPTMALDEICYLSVGDLAAPGCHLWLWTTNAFLREGFDVMSAWGFKYLAPIHWVKPSGVGNYVVHRTQTVLLGYKPPCRFEGKRYFPNVLSIPHNPPRHSEKPPEFYDLIEQVSPGPRLELFARKVRPGWAVWGNEVTSNIHLGDI
jgi:N6-adenosine-specific RNA methylase IME4